MAAWLAAGVGLALTACGTDAGGGTSGAQGSTTAPSTPAGVGDLTGTWVGDYRYPLASADGSPQVIEATETLVIEHHEGNLLWGVDQYVEDGTTIRIPIRGTVDASGRELTLTEEGGFFRGEVVDDTLRVRFTRTDDQFTSFEVTLHRQ